MPCRLIKDEVKSWAPWTYEWFLSPSTRRYHQTLPCSLKWSGNHGHSLSSPLQGGAGKCFPSPAPTAGSASTYLLSVLLSNLSIRGFDLGGVGFLRLWLPSPSHITAVFSSISATMSWVALLPFQTIPGSRYLFIISEVSNLRSYLSVG